jgi:Ca-activated chloride channel family protein
MAITSTALLLCASALVMPASSFDEVGTAELLRRTPDGPVPLPILDLQVHLEVTGMMVHGTVTQSFRNPTEEEIEAVYAFPLPEEAAVHHMEMRIGERRIVSVIQERQEARRTYVKAREEGRKAALVEQKRPNLFTASAANINPHETIEIVLEYVQELAYDNGEFRLTFPLTFTPRYGAPQEGPRPETRSAVAAQVPRARLEVGLDVGFPLDELDSPSHTVDTWWEGDTLWIEPAGGSVLADRDFVLRWRPQLDWEPRWAVHTESRQDGDYALLMLLPPLEDLQDLSGMATETLFIIDVSGSMQGPSIRQTRQALLAALDRLRPGDTFNLLAFNDDVTEFAPQFLSATEEAMGHARTWVRGLEAGGGTRIYQALQHGVLLTGATEPLGVRRLVFLTDGAVQHEEHLLHSILADLGDTRLHTLGIGRAPNRHLMRRMAEYGGGLCDFIADVSEAQDRMDAFLARLHRPVMTDLRLEWEGADPAAVYPSRLPDLHAGEPLFISARLAPGSSGGSVVLHGTVQNGPVNFEGVLEGNAPAASGVATRWGRTQIASLMQKLHAGGDEPALREKIITVSKTFHLVSRYTSLVAVEEFPTAVEQARQVRVPNGGALPSGGTSEMLMVFLATLLVMVGGTLLLLSRRPVQE